jgi:hypothetical protein
LLTAACARSTDPNMQPNPGTGYTVETTGADIVGLDNPRSTGMFEASDEVIATRLAAEICDREVRCYASTLTALQCRQGKLGRTRRELSEWRCSPAAMRARAERCLASIGNEPCELDLASRRSLCASNVACEADVPLPTPGIR